MKKKLVKCWDRFDDRLRKFCGELTPGKRLAVILFWLLFFSSMSIYFTVSSIYRMGQRSVKPSSTIEETFPESIEECEPDKNFEYEYE